MRRGVAGAVAGLIAAAAAAWAVELTLSLSWSLAIGALLGVVFAAVFGPSIPTLGAGLAWGQAYGVVVWLAGALTLLPIASGETLAWSLGAARDAFPLLLGLVFGYGAVLGLAYRVLVRGARGDAVSPLVRAGVIGAIGGLIGSWIFLRGIENADFYPLVASLVGSSSMGLGGVLHYAIGGVIGTSFGLLFHGEVRGAGSGMMWGLGYGLLWWVLGPLTLMAWLRGGFAPPPWSLAGAQSVGGSLLAHLLYGALMGLIYALGDRLWRLLFVDSDPLNRTREGAGARHIRGALMGQAGGLVGGLLFTIVMVGIGALPGVASLVGATSSFAGVVVHLAISVTIGTSYGLLFQREARGYGEGLASGLTYGLVWWVLGAATLFPILLRIPVDWSLPMIGGLYPSLVGHLFFGAGLGLLFPFLARRYDPAWRERTRADREIGASAPAVWAVMLVLGVMLPLLLVR